MPATTPSTAEASDIMPMMIAGLPNKVRRDGLDIPVRPVILPLYQDIQQKILDLIFVGRLYLPEIRYHTLEPNAQAHPSGRILRILSVSFL